VFFHGSSDGGATWSPGVRVNDITDLFQQDSPHSLVLLEDGTLTAAWFDNTDWVTNTIRASVSTDQGAHWSPSVRVDDEAMPEAGTGTSFSVAGFGNHVFAGFEFREADWNCYFRPSSDGGRTWVDPVVRMDDDAGGDVHNPVLAAAGASEVLAVWQDTRPGGVPPQIYSTRGTRDVTGVEPWTAPRPAPRPLSVTAVPNPFHPGDAVRMQVLDLVDRERVVVICDAAGRLVRRLRLDGGETTWDGRNTEGRAVPSASYWARPEGSGSRATRIVLVR
jgi:hypothetical protein